MKIKNQFRISIIAFVIILGIIASSIVFTEQQTAQLNTRAATALDIQTGASTLSYISNNYFLYQDNSSDTMWQTQFSKMANDIAKLNSTDPQQQTLVNNVNNDMQNLNAVFADTEVFLQNAPRNVSVRILPAFQTDWSRIAVQNQALAFDSQQLSQTLRNQVDQLNLTNIGLIIAFLGLFGAYFVTNYLITYRKTLKSISELQSGIAVIGSGNLNHSLKVSKNDEIGELSQAFNQMTSNLKIVTASKEELEQAQAALRESEQRWATTLASIGDAVIATDLLGNIIFMNGEAQELTGWMLNETSLKPAKSVFNIINEQTCLEVESPIDRVLKEGIVVGLANHTVLVRKDGSEIPIDDSGAPIKDKDGKTTGVVLIFRDITERKKAEEAVRRQANLIDLSPDAILVRGIDGNITFWSAGAEKLYGFSSNEALGQISHQLLKTQFPKSLDIIVQQFESTGSWQGELIHQTKAGHEVRVQSRWLIEKNGEKPSVLESNIDITERKRVELDLKHRTEQLENTQVKLEENAVQLEEYSSQMEELAEQRANQLKDSERLAAIGATAGMVGHDIRNPLQAITSDVYLAKTELASTPDSEEKKNALESMEEIEKNIDYINKIVQDLQDYARPLNPKIEESDLKTIVNALITKNGLPKNIKVNVEITDEATKVRADSYYLNRILYNLVTNAVQAMPNRGKLIIDAHKEADDTVLLVKDTGVGIPKEIYDKMFTLMFTTKSKGQGFGLPVVKRMAESLGGTVTFKSQEGKGTTFIVRLPTQNRKQ